MEGFDLSRKQIQRLIKDMREEGLVERRGSNRNGKWIAKKQITGEILFGMMSDERCMKKINVKVTFFLSLIAVVLLTAGILCGREVWLYEHPEIRITFSCDKRENIYRSYPFCVIRGRSHIGYAVRYDEEI